MWRVPFSVVGLHFARKLAFCEETCLLRLDIYSNSARYMSKILLEMVLFGHNIVKMCVYVRKSE